MKDIMGKGAVILIFTLLLILFIIDFATASIIISEAMPNPEGKDDAKMPEGEWMKLLNNGSKAEVLEGCYLTDAYDKHKLKIDNISFAGFEEVVVYRDGDRDFSLNNDGDTIKLWCSGSIVDEWAYGPVEEGEIVKRNRGQSENEENEEAYKRQPEKSEEDKSTKDEEVTDNNNDGFDAVDENANLNQQLTAESIIHILTAPENASYGEVVSILVNVYKGDTRKRVVDVYVKGLSKEEKFELKEKYENITKEVGLELDCGKGYNMFEIVAEGLDARDARQIVVEGASEGCRHYLLENDGLELFNVSREDFELKKAEGEAIENDINLRGFFDAKRIAVYLLGAVLVLLAVRKHEKAKNNCKGDS